MKLGERGRRVYCLTERGEKLLEMATPYWERAQDRLRRELGDADWDALIDFSERITQAAIRAEGAPSKNCRPAPRQAA